MNQQNRFRFRKNQDANSSQSEFIEQSNLGPIGQDELSFNTLLDGATGTTGRQGNTGPQGRQGNTGPQGRQGNTGPQGQTGRQGNTGPQGTQGITGPAGGPQGPTGPLGGPAGPQGLRGNTGGSGSVGSTGSQGRTGVQGSTGNQGSTGPQGRTGVQGITGSQGRTGVQGITGPQGRTGVQGITGPQGRTGVQGITGVQGRTGVQGNTGNQGFTGPQGLVGLVGATGIPGPTGPAGGPQGPTGPAGGPPGTQGPQGSKGGTGAAGQGVSINTLPTNTPIVTNNTLFETTGLTLSKASFRDVFRTVQGLTTSTFYNNQDQLLINRYQFLTGGFEPHKIELGPLIEYITFQGYKTIKLGHSYDANQWQLIATFNSYNGIGPYYNENMPVDDPLYNISRYFTHAKSDYTGILIEAKVKFNSGGASASNLRDELKLYIEKDNMNDETILIGTASSYNTTNSIHDLRIFLNQQTDFTLIVTIDRTVQSGSNTYVLPTEYQTLNLLDYAPEYGGRIRMYIGNGSTNGSRILSYVMTGYAWQAASNIF